MAFQFCPQVLVCSVEKQHDPATNVRLHHSLPPFFNSPPQRPPNRSYVAQQVGSLVEFVFRNDDTDVMTMTMRPRFCPGFTVRPRLLQLSGVGLILLTATVLQRVLHSNREKTQSWTTATKSILRKVLPEDQESTVESLNTTTPASSPSPSSVTAVAPDFERVDQLPQWLRAYVDLNNSSNLPANASVPILQYRCEAWCGGTGDRISGIVQSFYMALCTGRHLRVDWKRPDPLIRFLEPHFIPWDREDVQGHRSDWLTIGAIDRKDDAYLSDPYLLPANKDVELRTNMWRDEALVKETKCVKDYMDRFDDGRNATGYYRSAFWTLFKWSPLVVKGAEDLRREVKLDDAPNYVAVHIRTGNVAGTVDLILGTSHESTWSKYLSCARAFQEGLQEVCQRREGAIPIFLAADTADAKNAFLGWDDAVRTKLDLEVYHIDRTPTSNLRDAQQAALDVFRELKVLVDSTCLVMTRNGQVQSKYARLAQLLPTQPRCSAYWDDCGPEVVAEQLSHVRGRC